MSNENSSAMANQHKQALMFHPYYDGTMMTDRLFQDLMYAHPIPLVLRLENIRVLYTTTAGRQPAPDSLIQAGWVGPENSRM